jgi:hypothetical protein
MTPTDRVVRAMARLSRDRWLSAEEVRDLVCRLSRCVTWTPMYSWRRIPGECFVIGMLRGEPPAYVGDPKYGAFLKLLCDKKARRYDAHIEISILKLLTKARTQ